MKGFWFQRHFSPSLNFKKYGSNFINIRLLSAPEFITFWISLMDQGLFEKLY